MNLLRVIAATVVVASSLASAPILAQPPGASGPADMQMTAASRKALIDNLATEVERKYVFPDLAKQLGASLRDQHQRGAFDSVSSARQLSEMLTKELQAASRDRHLRVTYNEQPFQPVERVAAPSPGDAARRLAALRAGNFGVKKVEHLPFNVGYLELEGFAPAKAAAGTIAAAMTVLAHTDALIIDLRKNGGGDAAAVPQLASYLLDKRTHLSDFYYREGNRIERRRTSDAVPGLRYGQRKPVYVLTSTDTFSAAEDFTYALKNLKRVIVVGETTGGGANPGGDVRLSPHFSAFVPLGRSISPITKSNWEGVGVKPDVAVCADDALRVAQVAILTSMAESQQDVHERTRMKDHIAQLRVGKTVGKCESAVTTTG